MNKQICEFINQKYDLNLTENLSWDQISSIPTSEKVFSEEFIRDYHDELNLKLVSKYQTGLSTQLLKDYEKEFDFSQPNMAYNFLDDDLLDRHKHEVNWKYLSQYMPMSEQTIDKFKKFVNWRNVSKYQNLSETFIESHKNLINFNSLGMNRQFSEEFLINNKDVLNWNRFQYKNYFKSMSDETIETCKDYLNWDEISRLPDLSPEFINKYADKLPQELVQSVTPEEMPDLNNPINDTVNDTMNNNINNDIDIDTNENINQDINSDINNPIDTDNFEDFEDFEDLDEDIDNPADISLNASTEDINDINVSKLSFNEYCNTLHALSNQTFISNEDYNTIPDILNKIKEFKSEYPAYKTEFRDYLNKDTALQQYISQYSLNAAAVSQGEDRNIVDANLINISSDYASKSTPENITIARLMMEMDAEGIHEIINVPEISIKYASGYRTQDEEKLLAESQAIIEDAKNATKEGVNTVIDAINQTNSTLNLVTISGIEKLNIENNINIAQKILSEAELINKNDISEKTNEELLKTNNNPNDVTDAATATAAATAEGAKYTAEATVDLYNETNAFEQATKAFENRIIDSDEYAELGNLLKEDTGIVYALSSLLRDLTGFQRDIIAGIKDSELINSAEFQGKLENIRKFFAPTTRGINDLAVYKQAIGIAFLNGKIDKITENTNKLQAKAKKRIFKFRAKLNYIRAIGIDAAIKDSTLSQRYVYRYKDKLETKIEKTQGKLEKLMAERTEIINYGKNNGVLDDDLRKEYHNLNKKIKHQMKKLETLEGYKKGTHNVSKDKYRKEINKKNQKIDLIREKYFNNLEKMYEHSNRTVSRLDIADVIRAVALEKSKGFIKEIDENGEEKTSKKKMIDKTSAHYRLYTSLGGLESYDYRNKHDKAFEKEMDSKKLNYGSVAIVLDAYSKDIQRLSDDLIHTKLRKVKNFINKVSLNHLAKKKFGLKENVNNMNIDRNNRTLEPIHVENLLNLIEQYNLTPSMTNALVVNCLHTPEITFETLEESAKAMINKEKTPDEVCGRNIGLFTIKDISYDASDMIQVRNINSIKEAIKNSPIISQQAKDTFSILPMEAENIAEIEVKGNIEDMSNIAKILKDYNIYGQLDTLDVNAQGSEEFFKLAADQKNGFIASATYTIDFSSFDQNKIAVIQPKVMEQLNNLVEQYPNNIRLIKSDIDNPRQTVKIRIEGQNMQDNISMQIIKMNALLMNNGIKVSDCVNNISRFARRQLAGADKSIIEKMKLPEYLKPNTSTYKDKTKDTRDGCER